MRRRSAPGASYGQNHSKYPHLDQWDAAIGAGILNMRHGHYLPTTMPRASDIPGKYPEYFAVAQGDTVTWSGTQMAVDAATFVYCKGW